MRLKGVGFGRRPLLNMPRAGLAKLQAGFPPMPLDEHTNDELKEKLSSGELGDKKRQWPKPY